MSIVSEYKPEFIGAIDFYKSDINGLRTGRANAAIVENIMVEAYGGMMPVKGLASIAIPEARIVVIEPWDKSIIKDIEKAIRLAGTGLNPSNEGNILRLTLPQMTEENRKELIKVLGQKTENARIQVRKVREEIKEMVIEMEKEKEISEDERFKLQDELEKMTGEFNGKIMMIKEEKEKEIMTI
ncbi:MAG: ribosome recycling factor [Patescibacteria group bacterium]